MKLVKILVVLVSISLLVPAAHAYDQVTSDPNVCEAEDATILSANIETQILSTLIGIETDIICKETLTKKPMTVQIDERWKEPINAFCTTEKYITFCQNNVPTYTNPELLKNLTSYATESNIETSMKGEIETLVCYNSSVEVLSARILNTDLSLQERKDSIDLFFLIAPKEFLLSEISRLDRRLKRKNKDKFEIYSYLADKLITLDDESLNEKISDFIMKVADRGTNQPLKLKMLDSLFTLSKNGNRYSKNKIEELSLNTNQNTMTVKASEYLAELAELENNKILTIAVEEIVLPPKCAERSEEMSQSDLHISATELEDFDSFFKIKYDGIDLKVSTPGEDRYKRFFDTVTPSNENETSRRKWSSFINDYAAARPTITKNIIQQRAEQMYCRMEKLQNLKAKLSDSTTSLEAKLEIIKIIPGLTDHDMWDFIESAIENNIGNERIYSELVNIIKSADKQMGSKYLEMIYGKTTQNSLKLAIINSYEQNGLNLSRDNSIITSLLSNQDGEQSQIYLKRIIEILEKKEVAKKEQQVQSLNSLAQTDLSSFILQIRLQYIPTDLSSMEEVELNELITNSRINISTVTREIEELREELSTTVANNGADTSELQSRIDILMNTKLSHESVLSNAITQKALRDLEIMIASGDIDDDISKTKAEEIIRMVSDKARISSSSNEVENTTALLESIKNAVVKIANDEDVSIPSETQGTGTITGSSDDQLAQVQIPVDGGSQPVIEISPELQVPPNTPDLTDLGLGQVINLPNNGVFDTVLQGITGVSQVGDAIIEQVNDVVASAQDMAESNPTIAVGNVTIPERNEPSISLNGGMGQPFANLDRNDGPTRSFPTKRRKIRPASFMPSIPTLPKSNQMVGEVVSESVNGNILDGGLAVDNKVVNAPSVIAPIAVEQKQIKQKTNLANQSAPNSQKSEWETQKIIASNENPNIKNTPSQSNTKQASNKNAKANESIKRMQKEIENLRNSNSKLTSSKNNLGSSEYSSAGSVEIEQEISGDKEALGTATSPSPSIGSANTVASSSRAPASNDSDSSSGAEFLKDKKTGLNNLKSLDLIFLSNMEGTDMIGKEFMTVLVNDTTSQKKFLELLNTPEIISCVEIAFLDKFFKDHLSKVRTTRKGASELLVQSGLNSIRMTMPNRVKVKMMRDKHCSSEKELTVNTRHTASIDQSLEDLPEEGEEKPEELERTESTDLGKIIDGISEN